MSTSKNPVKNIIYDALQKSASDHIIIHRIDPKNSVMEIDYEKITKAILKSLNDNGYKIVKN